MGRDPLIPEREERALNQFRDERIAKLEEAVKDLLARDSERGAELSQLQQMISGVKATLEQYTQMLDGLKNLPNELMDALKKSNDAAKVYIDAKLGQAPQVVASNPGGIQNRLGEKIMGEGGIIDKVFDRVLSSPLTGGSPIATPIGPEIVDLERQMRTVFEYAYRDQMRKFVKSAASQLGIPTVNSVQVGVTHG